MTMDDKKQPVVPPPVRSATSTSLVPQADQTITHLKLLEALYTLRQTVESTDGIFGLSDTDKVFVSADETAEGIDKVREKRWAVYVQRAADRFERWWHGPVAGEYKDKIATDDVLKTVQGWRFPSKDLPPLDILMVWHSYMLNPHDYAEDCIVFGLQKMWAAELPWAAIDLAISSNEYGYLYDPGEEARSNFESKGVDYGLKWEMENEEPLKSAQCGRCNKATRVPWVVPCSQQALLPGTGFAEAGFLAVCQHCDEGLTHDSAKLAKFKTELTKMWQISNVASGLRAIGTVDYKNVPRAYAINLLADSNQSLQSASSMDDVRETVEKAMLGGPPPKRMERLQFRRDRMGLRKLLEGYMETSSNFSLDLASAVLRQSTFVEKMHKIGWINSDTLRPTITKLITKYTRFATLMDKYTYHVLVPTLDVDLAWHTHQLSPHTYRAYCEQVCKKFVDHDDKIDEGKLSDAFSFTCKVYEKEYSEVYSECMCWYCEAVRESNRGGIFSKAKNVHVSFYRQLQGGSFELNALLDIDRTAHISAHNAVKSPLTADQAKWQAQLKKNYIKAFDRAKKDKRPLPVVSGERDAKGNNDLRYLDIAMLSSTAPYAMYGYSLGMYPMLPACYSGCAGGGGFAGIGFSGPSQLGCSSAACGAASGGCGGSAGFGGGCGGGGFSGGSNCGGGGGGCGGGGT